MTTHKVTNMNSNYSALAKYYDKFTQNDCDYESWSQYLYDIATAHDVSEVVDIACGTGKMTKLLANKGFKLLGVDASIEMLSEAQSKCRAKFVLQDMRNLRLPHLFDMAVCVNDGVNYLKPTELLTFFQRVATNLKQGAPFVFDLSSPYKLTKVLGNNVFYWDDDNETLLWSNFYNGSSVELNLALFVKDGAGKYNRSDERHTQYVHAEQEVVTALNKAGFKLDQVSADYGKPLQDDSLRITYYATKYRS